MHSDNDNRRAIMTTAEVADELRCTPRHVRDLVNSGAIAFIKTGTGAKRPRTAIARVDFEAYIERNRGRSCQSTNQKLVLSTTSTSRSGEVGFTALRAARAAETLRQ
jgi:excisionase family DNA binding protein